eukprot:7944286-Lingulodinium_polyedra.AAC.1
MHASAMCCVFCAFEHADARSKTRARTRLRRSSQATIRTHACQPRRQCLSLSLPLHSRCTKVVPGHAQRRGVQALRGVVGQQLHETHP